MDEETKRKLMLALTAHADDLELYANGISEDAEAELAGTEEAIYALIGELYKKYGKTGLRMDYRTMRYLEALKERIREIRAEAFSEAEEDVEDASAAVAEEESEFLSDFYAFLTGAMVSMPTKKQLEAIEKYGIYNGNTRQQIFDKLEEGDVNRIYDAVSDSFQKGKTAAEAAEAVRRELRKTKRFIKSEIEVIINGIANDAALAFAAANKTNLVYSAVLDDRVCEECKGFDGRVFAYNDPDIPSLPRHVNCRCRLIPASTDGEVIEPASFEEYLASLPAKDQRKRLGEAKYRAWKNGDYQLKSYETPNPKQRKSIEEMRTESKKHIIDAKKMEEILSGGNIHINLEDAYEAVRTGFEVQAVDGSVCRFGEYLYKKYVLGERKGGATPNRLMHLARAVEAVRQANVSVTELAYTNPPQIRYVHRLGKKQGIVVFEERDTGQIRSLIYTNKQIDSFLEKYK